MPPAQADIIVEALRRKGLPFAYIGFEGEQHGFRKAENIIRAEEAELYFYGRVWGFTPADEIEPVEIENLRLTGAAACGGSAAPPRPSAHTVFGFRTVSQP